MAKKPVKPPVKHKRAKISYIQIYFEDRPPLVIDPKKAVCLVWGQEGVEVLEGFYLNNGDKEKAKQVRQIWEPGLMRDLGDDTEIEGPSGVLKTPDCLPGGWPPSPALPPK